MDNELLYRYLYGKLTDEEEQKVLDWLDSDPEKHLAEINLIHLTELSAQVHGDPALFTIGKFRWVLRYTLMAAASVVVLLGVWHLSNRYAYREMSSQVAKLEVPAGQRMNFTFGDGTQVWLNADSRIEYPPVFAGNVRRVKLSGEAIFEVKHDKDRPFIVETFASDIEVLGTRFSVDADEKHNRFSAMLLEGSVQIRSRVVPAQTITMQPNDRVDLIDGYLHKSQVSDFRELCWTEGIIHIRAMPFDELMRRLERAYNVNIIIERTTLPVIDVRSGKIRISEGIDYALHMLQRVSDFTYRYDEEQNQIVIR